MKMRIGVPVGARVGERVEAFAETGVSKLVIRPVEPPGPWADAVSSVVDVVSMPT